jgi:DNA-binding NarL/FixJ family response regulator
MRADRSLRVLPVIVFSSSDQPRHVDQAYASGANAYLVKAGDFRELVRHLRGMSAFWLQAARLPRSPGPSQGGPDITSP